MQLPQMERAATTLWPHMRHMPEAKLALALGFRAADTRAPVGRIGREEFRMSLECVQPGLLLPG